jgi:hypothetical protein
MADSYAVIVDIVGSRRLDDRGSAQRAIRSAFDDADTPFPSEKAIWATAGDEFQVRYARLADALGAVALVQLTLPDGLDCRYGIGRGDSRVVEDRDDGQPIQDGSAWYHARDAIDEAHRLADHGHPFARTWFSCDDTLLTAAVDAWLLQRDQVVHRMKARERRLAAGLLQGRTQAELASQEGISQSAVSQSLQRSGASALRAGLDALEKAGA